MRKLILIISIFWGSLIYADQIDAFRKILTARSDDIAKEYILRKMPLIVGGTLVKKGSLVRILKNGLKCYIVEEGVEDIEIVSAPYNMHVLRYRKNGEIFALKKELFYLVDIHDYCPTPNVEILD